MFAILSWAKIVMGSNKIENERLFGSRYTIQIRHIIAIILISANVIFDAPESL